MKKKLLVIVLAFCCVWGVFASKLTDAAASGDFDTLKKQIELLDYDVKGDGELLQICMCNWNCSDDTDWEKTQNYKKCVDYLMSKGAAMGKGEVIRWNAEVVIETGRYFNAYYGRYDFKKIDYMYQMKYDNVNREWDSQFFPNWKEKTSRVDELLSLDQWGSKGDGDYEVQLLMLMQYNPIVKKTDSWKYDLLSADMATIKKRLRNGAKYEDLQLLLFINNPKIIELLEAAEAYKLPDYFNGRITPYLINEIIPKYCTHITSKEEIAFMKFITNYNSSMDREKSLAFVKDLISKGLDLNATPKILGGIRLSMLPVYIKNTDGVKLLGEFLKEKAEQKRIERERKAEEERIARIEQEKKVEEDLITNYLAIFSNDVRDILMIYGTMKKGKYKIKSKDYVSMVQRNRLYNEVLIRESMSGKTVLVSNNLHNDPFLYKFSIADGYTVEMVQKVWNMAVDKLCDEFGLQ